MKRFRYPIFIAAVLMLGVATVFAIGLLNLPPGPVAVTHGLWNQGSSSTINITLSSVPIGAPPGYHVWNGTFAGWCIEDNHQFDTCITFIAPTNDGLY